MTVFVLKSLLTQQLTAEVGGFRQCETLLDWVERVIHFSESTCCIM